MYSPDHHHRDPGPVHGCSSDPRWVFLAAIHANLLNRCSGITPLAPVATAVAAVWFSRIHAHLDRDDLVKAIQLLCFSPVIGEESGSTNSQVSSGLAHFGFDVKQSFCSKEWEAGQAFYTDVSADLAG